MANKRIRRTSSFSSYLAAATQDVIDLKNRNNISDIGASTITGTNLANDVSISTTSITSADYSEGTSGWKIDGTGTAEFSNVFVRGDINAYSGTIGYWNISNPGVERTIGGKRLFGTFLESENLGDTDVDNTPGVYVGLYRSYREDAIDITSAYRRNGIATVVAANHGYKSGDLVSLNITGTLTYTTEPIYIVSKNVTSNVATLTLEIAHLCQPGDSVTIDGMGAPFDGTFTVLDGTIDKILKYAVSSTNISETAVTDTACIAVQNVSETGATFSTGSSYTTVIDSDYNSFKFENSGVNTDSARGNTFTGTAQLYDDNVAGIYLQDYSKSLFDYGYFSNEGVQYVSAATYNAIYNPSFEYYDIITETVLPSTSQWSSTENITLSSYNLSGYTSSYIGSSSYGLEVSWGSATSDYVTGTIGYSSLDQYVSRNRDLYLNFDIFVNPFTRTLSATGFSVSGDNVVVTCVDHGLSTGNTIRNYSDAVSANQVIDVNVDHVVTVVDADSFTVLNTKAHDGAWTSDGTSNLLYLVNIPKYDVSEIQLKFPGSETLVRITDVLTDDIKASWSAVGSNAEILTISKDDIDLYNYYSVASTDGSSLEVYSIPKMTPTVVDVFTAKSKLVIKIDISKLYAKYRELDPSGLSSKSDISILLPAWIKDENDVKISYHSLILDNLYLSTENKFFYGNSNQNSTDWVGVELESASVEDPKNWLSIDLLSQTASINYLDAVTFKSSTFNGYLYTNSGIYTDNTNYDYNDVVLSYSTTTEDASDSVLLSTSGRYRRYLNTKTASIYSIATHGTTPHQFLVTTTAAHGFTYGIDQLFIYDSNNIDFNDSPIPFQIVSIESDTSLVITNPLASTGDAHDSVTGNGTITNSSYDFIDYESYSSSKVTKTLTSYQISSVMDMYDSSDMYGLLKAGVSSADISLESDEAWSEITVSSDKLYIKNRNLEHGRNNTRTLFDKKTPLEVSIEGSVKIINNTTDPSYIYFIDAIVDDGGGSYTLTIDTTSNDFHRLTSTDSVMLTAIDGTEWIVPIDTVPSNTTITFTETSTLFDVTDFPGETVEKVYVSYPYLTSDIPVSMTSPVGKYYLATIDYVSAKASSAVDDALTTALADYDWIKSTTTDGTTTYPIDDPLTYDGISLGLSIDTSLVISTAGELGVDVDALTTTVLEGITADSPLDFTAGTLSITNGYVYNDDNADYAKLWVSATEPTGAAVGDIWIATA